MSWLNNITDLAGKAESLLNNIDQSAAVAISKASSPNRLETDTKKVENLDKIALKEETSLVSSDSQSNLTTPSFNKQISVQHREIERSKTKKEADDALFDFLNSSKKISKSHSAANVSAKPSKLMKDDQKMSKQVGNTPGQMKVKDRAELDVSRNSSYDSLVSKKSGRKISDNGSLASDHHESNFEPDSHILPADSTASESDFEMVASLASKDSDRDSPSSSTHVVGSDVTVENRLLKSELTSLHQELTHTAERNRKIKEELQQSNQDLFNRCEDLQEELKAKHTQFSALQMKFHEIESLLAEEQNTTAQLKSDNERILRDQSEGSGMHARTIEELRIRLNEMENFLAQEKHAHDITKHEVLDLRSRMDSESKKVVESLQKAEMDKQKEKKKFDDLNMEIRTLNNNLNLTKQELSDYKQKAARILQSKERLIASLKGGSESEMSSSTIASLEFAEVKQERDNFKEDLQAVKFELANTRSEFQDAEQQFQQDQSILQQEINGFRRDLDEEIRGRQEAEFELHRLQEEMRRDREDNARSRTLTQSRLHDKDLEIERLRNQLMLRSQSTPQESELESRLRQLTEAVIQKQSLVETLSAEKSSLTLQMERMEGQIKRLSQESSRHTHINMAEEESRSSSSGLIFSHGNHHGVVGKVKRAASALDQFSIRLGIFLKRYPPARLFVLIYMGILHIWVMIVLLTYTPEAHDEDFLKSLKHDKNL